VNPLADGLHAVPPGKLATIVTHLEMRAPYALTGAALPPDVTLQAWRPDLAAYRDLHRRVGEEWLWNSRLTMSDAALAAILSDPAVAFYALMKEGVVEALLELDFRQSGACEIAYFGLTRALIGSGAGKALMAEAIQRAWTAPIERLWVHTCTLDSPQALGFYRRCGFVPVAQEVEIMDDPRVTGLHPVTAGPHIPYLPEPASSAPANSSNTAS